MNNWRLSLVALQFLYWLMVREFFVESRNAGNATHPERGHLVSVVGALPFQNSPKKVLKLIRGQY